MNPDHVKILVARRMDQASISGSTQCNQKKQPSSLASRNDSFRRSVIIFLERVI
jgi:hypothetical protein